MNDRWYYRLINREWKANRVAHLLVIAVLALTLVLYGFYGLWGEQAATEGTYSTDRLDLPSRIMVFYPEWTSRLSHPGFALQEMVRESRVQRLVHHASTGLFSRISTEVGTVDAWGLDTDDSMIRTGVRIAEGEWLSDSDDIILTCDLAERLQVQVGDALPLKHLPSDGGEPVGGEFVVRGVAESRDGVEQLVMFPRDVLASLADMPSHNAAWLWPETRMRNPTQQVKSALQSLLPRVRSPLYPYSHAAGDDVDNPSDHEILGRMGGLPGPFLNRVEPTYLYRRSVGDHLASVSRGGVVTVSGLIGLMFIVVAVALTITVLIMVLDRQTTIGLYATLGMKPSDIGNMFRVQLIFDSLVGTTLGAAALAVLLSVMGAQEAITGVPTLTAVLWLALQVVLVLWGARVATVLSGSSDLRAHLRGDTDFDWWSLVRITPQPAGEDAEGVE